MIGKWNITSFTGKEFELVEEAKTLGVGIHEQQKAEQGDWYTDWKGKRSSAWALSPCRDKTVAFKHRRVVSFKSVFVPILIYGHEFWVRTERLLTQGEAEGMKFVRHFVKKCPAVKLVKLWMSSRATSANTEISTAVVRPRDQHAQWKIGETSPTGCTQGKAAQKSTKDHVTWLNLFWPDLV